ncbi:LOW QUALITY PROTEIN: coiled-coil domain-containing protein 22, partial [Sphaerodactylus townsendi]|uniref:LOW QUALITY PROTEIN: coiled-coil domain-containing protein 22 n=1 Tax=Sphaerodactylus townsendi TaxID=933632 RepID=UPI0020261299
SISSICTLSCAPCLQLLELESLPKDVTRSAYTQRILEIVSNIRKQKEEITKILSDTKELQKEINSLTGKLDRTFAVTDELIFKDAKRDEAVRKAYKYLAALHESCSQLIQTIEDTGTILREIRDLEEQIESETSKKTLEAGGRDPREDYRALTEELTKLLGITRETCECCTGQPPPARELSPFRLCSASEAVRAWGESQPRLSSLASLTEWPKNPAETQPVLRGNVAPGSSSCHRLDIEDVWRGKPGIGSIPY